MSHSMATQKSIPRICETCLCAVVHDNCADCLGAGPRFEYRNWKAATFGQAMALEHERQVSGERNIVVGGMGEAEVKAKWSVQEAYDNLDKVSQMCGYMIYPPRFSGDEACIRIQAHGEWFLIWKAGAFDRIEDRSGRRQWSRHPDFLKVKDPCEWLEGYGFPRVSQPQPAKPPQLQ